MNGIRYLFWDIGGVLLTDGWNTADRRAVAARFGLAWESFELRHQAAAPDFDEGLLSLEAYLDRVVFQIPRPFGREAFVKAMLACSRPLRGGIDLVLGLKAAGRYRLAALSNESRDLNRYRVDAFGLRECFDAFACSCYLGVRKPDSRIYRMALDLMQAPPQHCLFVDDRPVNVEAARALGIRSLLWEGPEQGRRDLAALGVEAEPQTVGG